MTVVLQHQFWDLSVSDSAFEVGLSFKGVPETLHVPFRAIASFVDPHAGFQVKFDTTREAAVMEAAEGEAGSRRGRRRAGRDGYRRRGRGARRAADAEPGTAAVVSLDAFRKKNG